MTGPAVVIVDNGIPVTPVEDGAPVVTVAASGVPITLTDYGTPMVVQGLDPPVPPVPGPLDFVVYETDLTTFTQPYDLATPNAIFGIACRYTGNPTLAATHGGEPLTLIRADKGDGVMTALFYGSGLTVEDEDLVINVAGGTIGPVMGRINDDYVVESWGVGWDSGAIGTTAKTAELEVDDTVAGIMVSAWAGQRGSTPATCEPAAEQDTVFSGIVVAGDETPLTTWTLSGGWTDEGGGSYAHTGDAQSVMTSAGFTANGPIGFMADVDIAAGATLTVVYVNKTSGLTQRVYYGPFVGVITDMVDSLSVFGTFRVAGKGDITISDFNLIENPLRLFASFGRSKGSVSDGDKVWYQAPQYSPYAVSAAEVHDEG